MARAGLKPADIVKRSRGSITHARLNNWLKGYNDPRKEVLTELAALTGSTVAELLGEVPLKDKPRAVRARSVNEVEVPRLQPISAGQEWTDPFDSDQTEPIPGFMATPVTFVVSVDGDSMYDLLEPGDLAVFVQHPQPQIGLIVVARNHEGGMTIKQLKHDGREYVLHPLNPSYDDILASRWHTEGYLVGIIRDHAGERTIRHNPKGLRP
jgi:SOS-response transcriptional repressor LexA